MFVLTSSASAQLIVTPHGDVRDQQIDLTVALSGSEIEYELEDSGGSADIDRTIVGIAAAFGLSPVLDLYGEFGYIVEAEVEGADGDDDGALLGAGVRGVMYKQDGLSVHGLAGVRFISEEYGDGVEGELFELPLSVVLSGKVDPNFQLYGGLDLVPISEGDVDFPGAGSADIERDDIIGVRFGGDYSWPSLTLNLEVALVSEESFTARLTFPL